MIMATIAAAARVVLSGNRAHWPARLIGNTWSGRRLCWCRRLKRAKSLRHRLMLAGGGPAVLERIRGIHR